MKAEISSFDGSPDSSVSISEGETVRVFRVEDRMHEVVAKKDGEITPLGTHDASVSREYDNSGEPGYIEFYEEDKQIYVRDTGSTTPTTLQNVLEGEIELTEGDPHILTDDCKISIGQTTALQVEVEQEETRGTEAIRIQADHVYKISDVKPAAVVRAETEDLFTMLKEDSNSGARYESALEQVEAAIESLSVVNETSEPLPGKYDEPLQKVTSAADSVRKLY
jgi:hypothetical protein